ncbi:MAG: class I SAM-dependent methyltransferase [Desulfovibrio sp.]|nr:MAG: class I SAM-dependent methyltransferase [Desulfovibrio sp.]
MAHAMKQSITKYWDTSAQGYDSQFGHGIGSASEKELWLDLLRRNMTAPPGARILDLGCGTGFLSLLLAELGFKVTGIDLSEEMRALAASKAAEKGLALELMDGDAENPDFPEASFDGVISRHLAWTLPDPQGAAQNWKRVLKPGGIVLIIDGVWIPRNLGGRMRHMAAGAVRLMKGKLSHFAWRKQYVNNLKELPFFGGTDPAKIQDVLQAADFRDSWLDHMDQILTYERKNGPLEYRITHGVNRRYLVGAYA